MYLDELPEVAIARRFKTGARGRALRDADGRATAVVFTGSGEAPDDWIVRFDIAEREDPGRRLADGLVSTGASSFFYFGLDPIARRAVASLGLEAIPRYGVAVRRNHADLQGNQVELRSVTIDDDTRTLIMRHSPSFVNPRIAAAFAGATIVGYALVEELSQVWSELSVFVYPQLRGRGYGARIFARSADLVEEAGRFVCATFAVDDEAARGALERAGFRLADYFFVARRPKTIL
jgi:GNAT superfamily N-acetyltransferase